MKLKLRIVFFFYGGGGGLLNLVPGAYTKRHGPFRENVMLFDFS